MSNKDLKDLSDYYATDSEAQEWMDAPMGTPKQNKIHKFVDKQKKQTLLDISNDLLEAIKKDNIKQLILSYEDKEGYCRTSYYARSKWELIGMIQQQIIYWTMQQAEEE